MFRFFNFDNGVMDIVIKIYSLFFIENILLIVINRVFGYWSKDSEDYSNGIIETVSNSNYIT